MIADHTNRPSNIAWRWVSSLHPVLMWLGIVAVLSYALGFTILHIDFAPRKKETTEPEAPKSIDSVVLAESKRKAEEQSRQMEAEKNRIIDENKKIEIQRRRIAEEAKRTRTANEATETTLKDFL